MKGQFEHGRVQAVPIQPPGQERKLSRVGAFTIPAVKQDHGGAVSLVQLSTVEANQCRLPQR